MTLEDLQKQIEDWNDHNFPNSEPWMKVFGVMEELGELCHAYLKQVQGIRVTEDHRAKKIDAVGDIVVFLVGYCLNDGIDFSVAVEETWKKVQKRDWVHNKVDGGRSEVEGELEERR